MSSSRSSHGADFLSGKQLLVCRLRGILPRQGGRTRPACPVPFPGNKGQWAMLAEGFCSPATF
ncbi:hypothetical protein PGTUg99_020387 [Puccinia graminis f. sp. tritici]|uniref:Uncharacterized protein n=1 Tax=Puccinia graminis f. sp. tritici TaxID=56615 RepID=A0A5B0SI57_PUCGR|nr:hypothetical protein PGTUg99_020387 [Puccinia graminis f. sp. tritici]